MTQKGSKAPDDSGKARPPKRAAAEQTVDGFLAKLDHALKPQIIALRPIILGADPSITEGIKWNAPSFRTSEWFATMRLHGKDGMQLILHFGAKKGDITTKGVTIPDPHGLLEWLAKDRAVVRFSGVADVAAKQHALAELIREWIRHVVPPVD